MTNGPKARRSGRADPSALLRADEIQQLFLHCRQGSVEAVESWLSANYLNGNAEKSGQSPLKFLLFSTPSRPRKELLYELREPASGYSLLHQAALHGHLSIVQLLKQREPRLLELRDRRGCLPLQLAAWGGYESVVEELLTPQTLNSANNARESAMHLASMRGHAAVVEFLLRRGGDASLRNARHETALDVAARTGNADVCRVIVGRRPELALQSAADCSTSKCPALYPLHAAARHGYTDCVKVLCQARFDVNYVTEEGSALHVSALAGHTDTVRELLEQGADPSIRDCERKTALERLNERGVAQKGVTESASLNECRAMIQAHIGGRSASQPAKQHRPFPKPRRGVVGGGVVVAAAETSINADVGIRWIPVPESSIVRLNSLRRAVLKPEPVRRAPPTNATSTTNSRMNGDDCGCRYAAPATYDAWVAPITSRLYTNAESPLVRQQPLLPLNYDNVPRSLLVYDNAPPPGHQRWHHHCASPLKPSHSTSSAGSDPVVISRISGSESSSTASSATPECGDCAMTPSEEEMQIVVEGLLAPLARPEELSCSNSTNFSVSPTAVEVRGDGGRAGGRAGTTSSEDAAQQKSSSTLVEGGGSGARQTFVNGVMLCSLDSITSSCSLPVVSQLSTTPPSPSPRPLLDDKAQWKDIEEILETLYDAGGGGGGGEREDACTSKAAPKSELFYWLRDRVGLAGEMAPEAESRRLVNNGFDRVDMLKGSLTALHMIEMGTPGAVQLAIADWLGRERREKIRPLKEFGSLYDWLHSLGLTDYAARFEKANLTDVSDIAAARLTRGDLEKMGIVRLGHVSRILRSLTRVGEKTEPYGRTQVASPLQSFSAHYLGSREIRNDPCGGKSMDTSVMTDRCRNIITQLKLQKELDAASSVPQVRLQISHEGVVLKESSADASRSVMHAVDRISAVCQDETDPNFFAYVYCDGGNESSCHVFCLLTVGLAREAITALKKSRHTCDKGENEDHTV